MMTPHPPTTEHNYLHKQARLLQMVPLGKGTVTVASVAHDDWCDAINGRGYCNCDPDIKMTNVTDTPARN
jgi:hypothetical protein